MSSSFHSHALTVESAHRLHENESMSKKSISIVPKVSKTVPFLSFLIVHTMPYAHYAG